MANYTLDDIRAAAEAKYGATVIDLGEGRELRLLNPLRLTKQDRDEMRSLQDFDGEEEQDEDVQIDALRNVLRIASKNSPLVDELFAVLGEDLGALMAVIEAYNKGTQAGEA